jgi:hypothetical protein
MNHNLLVYAASQIGNQEIFAAAVQHACTTARAHVCSDGSITCLVVFNRKDGGIKHQLTNQGFSHNSC